MLSSINFSIRYKCVKGVFLFCFVFYNLEQVNKIVQSVQLAESTFMSSGWRGVLRKAYVDFHSFLL